MAKLEFNLKKMEECKSELLSISSELDEEQRWLTSFARTMDHTQRSIKNIRDYVYLIKIGKSGNQFSQFGSVVGDCHDLYQMNEKYYEEGEVETIKEIVNKQKSIIKAISIVIPPVIDDDETDNKGDENGSNNNESTHDTSDSTDNKENGKDKEETVAKSELDVYVESHPEIKNKVDALKMIGISETDIMSAINGGVNVETYLLQCLQRRNEEFLSHSNMKDLKDGGCVTLTCAKFDYYMTADWHGTVGNGRYAASDFANLDTGGKVSITKYSDNYGGCLQQIIDANNGNAVTDVIVSYDYTGNRYTDEHPDRGHVIYIDAIVDGKVYFTDNYNNGTTMNVETLQGFQNRYLNKTVGCNDCGLPTTAVHCVKNQ